MILEKNNMNDDRVIRLITVILAAIAGYTFNNGVHAGDAGSIIMGMVLFIGSALASYYIKV